MDMIRYLLLLLFVPSFFQSGEPMLHWQADEKLTWDDFQGQADYSIDMSAHTTSRINYGWKCKDGEFLVEVESIFDRERSWKKDLQTNRLLEHEQLHFDITEWYARKLRQTFASIDDACFKPVDDVKAQANAIRSEWKETQDLYDFESDHGRDFDRQDEWEDRVAGELVGLEEFADD
jgi:hypothetical protein